ncbi:hypothetical protein IAT40_006905 [Kwoniella sp. CBS 6097]
MKFTLPLTISFALLASVASAVPGSNGIGNELDVAKRGLAPAHHARSRGIDHVRRQDDSSNGDTTGDANNSGDASTDDGSTDDGSTDDGSGSGTTDDGSGDAGSTASATYDGSGGQEQDGGPSLTLTDSSTATDDGSPVMYTLTSDSASDVAATSADPNATPSSAPPSSSSSHSGLTDYNTTTRSATGNVQGTSAAQTKTGASASASSSAPSSSAKPALMAISPMSILTVVVAGAVGVAKVLY